uniref:Uncharacterized protein n=1 Tax=Timema tahoe TaxID=61484 RepID=A0A7R9IUA9_9NEOP|nr:unnamed protein product [Timema tahoe]
MADVIVKRSFQPWLQSSIIFWLSATGRLQRKSLAVLHGMSDKAFGIPPNILSTFLETNKQFTLAEDGAYGDEEDNSSIVQEIPIPSAAEAMEHIQELRCYCESRNNVIKSKKAEFIEAKNSEKKNESRYKQEDDFGESCFIFAFMNEDFSRKQITLNI